MTILLTTAITGAGSARPPALAARRARDAVEADAVRPDARDATVPCRGTRRLSNSTAGASR